MRNKGEKDVLLWAYRARQIPSAGVGLVEYWWPGLFPGDKAADVGPGAILWRAHRTSLRVPSTSPHHKALHTPRAPICPNRTPSPTTAPLPSAHGAQPPSPLTRDPERFVGPTRQ